MGRMESYSSPRDDRHGSPPGNVNPGPGPGPADLTWVPSGEGGDNPFSTWESAWIDLGGEG